MKDNSKNLKEEMRNLSLEEGGNKTGIAYITAYELVLLSVVSLFDKLAG